MLVSKTVRCKLVDLTNRKLTILENEYAEANRLQQLLSNAWHFGDVDYFTYKITPAKLYSHTKAAILFKFKKPVLGEQPLYLCNRKLKIGRRKTKLASYWLRIPVYGIRGGIWVALKFGKLYNTLIERGKLRDSKLVKKGKKFYAYLTFQQEIELRKPRNILAVDLGERVMATVCGSFDNQRPRFYGRKVRGIRRHYAWLRKRLGNKKLLKKIKQIGHKEQQKVDAILHEISQSIVELADKHDALIVLGDLKGIRASAKKKGRRMRRIVSSMPYLKLSNFIEYKAAWLGIPTMKISERGTSKYCSRCGKEGKRPNQANFVCQSCGYKPNADHNGALNILKRVVEYFFAIGVFAYAQKPCIDKASTINILNKFIVRSSSNLLF